MTQIEIILQKKEFRKKIKEIKSKYSDEEKIEKSQLLFNKLTALPIFASAKTIMCYWSMPDEVHTHDVIVEWSKHKEILLPIIEEDMLKVRKFESIELMQEMGKFRIMEPTGKLYTTYKNIDLILVPGLAFDEQMNRLGRGKGYYDNFLPLTNAHTIGICFDFQFFKSIPHQNHDIKVERIIYA
jgi:5-formyltetrahydrofolate cyclo-ligase